LRRSSTSLRNLAAGKIVMALKRHISWRRKQRDVVHVDVRPLPTLDQFEEIAQEAEAEVQRLNLQFIKLCMDARRIESQQISFHGSGPESADFSEVQTAHGICDDVAKVMHACNAILDAKGLRRFGLSVEGHTSAPASKEKDNEEKFNEQKVPLHRRGTRATASKEREKVDYTPMHKADPHGLIALSTKRACTVARRIERTYKTFAGSTLTAQAVGHGANRPLPGYDDGKNHPENRRVEFRLLVGDEVELGPRSFDKGLAKSTRVLVGIDDHDEDVVSRKPPRRLSVSRTHQTRGDRLGAGRPFPVR